MSVNDPLIMAVDFSAIHTVGWVDLDNGADLAGVASVPSGFLIFAIYQNQFPSGKCPETAVVDSLIKRGQLIMAVSGPTTHVFRLLMIRVQGFEPCFMIFITRW